MSPRKKVKTVKRPARKTAKPSKAVKRKVPKPKRKVMANTEKPSETPKADEKKPSDAPTITPFGHKNPPVGPATTKPLQDWRKDRDYENFNPTAEK
jgi:hypothetical protein